jgi:hypothetical protein
MGGGNTYFFTRKKGGGKRGDVFYTNKEMMDTAFFGQKDLVWGGPIGAPLPPSQKTHPEKLAHEYIEARG